MTNDLTRRKWIKRKITEIRTRQKKLRNEWLDLDTLISGLNYELDIYFSTTFRNVPKKRKGK